MALRFVFFLASAPMPRYARTYDESFLKLL